MASGVQVRAPPNVRAVLNRGGRPHRLSKTQERLVHYCVRFQKMSFSVAIEWIKQANTA